MRTLLKIGLAVAAVTIAVVVTVSAQEKKKPEPQKDERFVVNVTEEMRRHSRIREVVYFAGFAYGVGVLALILVSGLSRRMRDAAARVTKRPFWIAFIYLAMFTVVTTLLEFPLTYYSGFLVPHQFDLTNQTFGSWMSDLLKGVGVGLVLSGLMGALALLGIRKVKRWWLVIWAGAVPISVLLIALQPLVLDPIFNRFEPLQDRELRTKLLDLASRAGIEGGRVYQVNKSKQTTTMNAYVNGIGPTNRIVMWDTLLAKMSHDEVLGVMGHEMGHYVLKHIWKGLAFGLALGLPLMFIGQQVHDRGLAKWGAKWGIAAPGDPASVPWLLLILTVGSFLISPIGAGFSRYQEHEADVFALELTHLNESFATAFIKFAEDSKRDPDPHPFIEFWRYSHPPINKRIAFALGYRPWEEGKPNEAWEGE